MFDIDKLSERFRDRERNILGHEKAMHSAVLVPLLRRNNEWHVLFEVRSHDLKRQPGEICFPGGRVEPQDEDDRETAVRETCEELQIPKERLEILGPLDILVQSQNFFIYPYVGIIEEDTTIHPNEEVEEIFTVPLSWFRENKPELHHLDMKIKPDQDFPFELIPNGKNYNWRGRRMPEYFYIYKEWVIWGLTARILRHFLEFV
ncbi:MAG TPA: CoA pyrophosphatase [Bacillales bacterium]|nr:CoA pyrophosphatase [Bacillales bacterium]